VDITAKNVFLSPYDKKVKINMGLILNGYEVMGYFLIVVKTLL
jgi:hypothetical protein